MKIAVIGGSAEWAKFCAYGHHVLGDVDYFQVSSLLGVTEANFDDFILLPDYYKLKGWIDIKGALVRRFVEFNQSSKLHQTIVPEESKDTQTRIKEITNAMQKVLLEKNKRYGDSAINPKNRFSKLSGSEGIKIRLDDKMNRIENSGELRTNDVCDMIGYLFLYLVSEGVSESDILKLID